MRTLYTIGFTRSSAEHFFGRLRDAGVRRLLDVRLHNRSQLAGFSKAGDLEWFLAELLDVAYEHRLDPAPTAELLKDYQQKRIGPDEYAEVFRTLLVQRDVAGGDRTPFEGPTVLLCSEADPDHCHRRVVAEHLAEAWGGLTVTHL